MSVSKKPFKVTFFCTRERKTTKAQVREQCQLLPFDNEEINHSVNSSWREKQSVPKGVAIPENISAKITGDQVISTDL